MPAKPRWNRSFQRLWVLHWAMTGCLLLIYLAGMTMVRLPRETPIKEPLFNVHTTLGNFTLILLFLRIFTLLQIFSHKYLKWHPNLSLAWFRTAALHSFIYILMLVIPVTGIFISSRHGLLIPMPIPSQMSENRSLMAIAHNLHVWLSYTLLVFVGLHAIDQRLFLQKVWKRLSRA